MRYTQIIEPGFLATLTRADCNYILKGFNPAYDWNQFELGFLKDEVMVILEDEDNVKAKQRFEYVKTLKKRLTGYGSFE